MKTIWIPPKNELVLFLNKSDVIKFINKLGFTSLTDLSNRGIYVDVAATRYVRAKSRFPVFAATNITDGDSTVLINSNIRDGIDVLEIINESGVSLHSDYEFPCVAHIWDESRNSRGGTDTINLWQVKPLNKMTTIYSLEEAEEKYLPASQELLDFAINAQSEAKEVTTSSKTM